MTPFRLNPKQTLAAATLCVLALIGLWAARGNAADAQPADAQAPTAKPALTVSTARPVLGRLPVQLSANGNITAWQEASIGAEANGLRLQELRAAIGDTVRAGQVLRPRPMPRRPAATPRGRAGSRTAGRSVPSRSTST
jgi:multidrug efflux pump subunit AcrA (membrane-fusion protein)